MPLSGTKVSIGSTDCGVKPGWSLVIQALGVDCVAPPNDVFGMILHSEEDDDTAESDTSIHTTRKNIVVFLPPGSPLFSYDVHENEGENQTRSVVTQVVWCPLNETKHQNNWVEVLSDDGSSAPLSESPSWERN